MFSTKIKSTYRNTITYITINYLKKNYVYIKHIKCNYSDIG